MTRFAAFIVCAMLASIAHGGELAPVRHAYVLLAEGSSTDCERCYVPLLLTRDRIAPGVGQRGYLVVTYRRDSVWEIGDEPVRLREIDEGRRTVRIGEIRYRYVEIHASEARRLLQQPEGGLPVHRPGAPVKEHQKGLVDRWIRELEAAAR